MKRSLIASFAVLSMAAAPALAATANAPVKPTTAKVAKTNKNAKQNKLAGAKVTKTAAKKPTTKTN